MTSIANAAPSSPQHATPILEPASASTLSRRKAAAKFLRRTRMIWKEMPAKETGVIVSRAIVDEVVHCATAFHVGKHGGPNLFWLKKDIPKEAALNAKVGYWRRNAGPAARQEQKEMSRIMQIPEHVVDYINDNNDQAYIAHFLYAYINLWCIVTKHWIIWLVCIFLCGFLCIIRPIILVGESSKLYRIFAERIPSEVFLDNIGREDFQNFLCGTFDLKLLLRICKTTVSRAKEWEELPLLPDDYIHILGIPIVVQYGPHAAYSAIYIPKYHPYRPNHSKSVALWIYRVDRACRLMAKLSQQIVQGASPIPFDETRGDVLMDLKSQILEEAVKRGLWQHLKKVKLELQDAQVEFLAPKNVVAAQNMTAEQRHERSVKAAATSRARALKVMGLYRSEERRKWVVDIHAREREKVERGHLTRLIPTPRDFDHGSEEQAFWLFNLPTAGVTVIDSANGYRAWKAPVTEDEKAMRKKVQMAAGQSAAVFDTFLVSSMQGLTFLCKKKKAASQAVNNTIQLNNCPHCTSSWITKDTANTGKHTCIAVRDLFFPLLVAEWKAKSKAQPTADDKQKPDGNEPSLSLTRALPCSGKLPWKRSERLSTDSEIFSRPDVKASRPRRTTNAGDPVHARVMDSQGRLDQKVLKREVFVYPFQLVDRFPDLAPNGQWQQQDGVQAVRMRDFAREHVFTSKVKPQEYASREEVIADKWLACPSNLSQAERDIHLLTQAKALIKNEGPIVRNPVYGMPEVRLALTQRIELDQLSPYFFDTATHVDIYKAEKALQEGAESAQTVASSAGIVKLEDEGDLNEMDTDMAL